MTKYKGLKTLFLIVLLSVFLVSSLGACTPIYEGRPTAFPTQAPTDTPNRRYSNLHTGSHLHPHATPT